MVLNRKPILATMTAAGIAVGALAGGGAAFASTASPAHSAASAIETVPASVWRGHGCGKGGMWSHHPVPKPVADYLGLTQAELQSRLRSGKSLADVARAQGKPVSGLKSTILADVTSRVNASMLSPAQKAKVISQVKGHLDAIVNTTCRSGKGAHKMSLPMGLDHRSGTVVISSERFVAPAPPCVHAINVQKNFGDRKPIGPLQADLRMRAGCDVASRSGVQNYGEISSMH